MTPGITHNYYLHFAVEKNHSPEIFLIMWLRSHCSEMAELGFKWDSWCSRTSSEPLCSHASLPKGQNAVEQNKEKTDLKGNTSKRVQEPEAGGQGPMEAEPESKREQEMDKQREWGMNKISRDSKETKNIVTELKYTLEVIKSRTRSLYFCFVTFCIFQIPFYTRYFYNQKTLKC